MAYNMNTTVVGLTATSFGIPAAAQVPVTVSITTPNIPQGDSAASAVVMTVTQTPSGGSPTTVYTSTAGARGFDIIINCAALDTLTFTTTSSAAVDQGKNVIKTTISLG